MPTIHERIEHYDLDGNLVSVEDADVERPETVAEMMAALDARIEQLHGRVQGVVDRLERGAATMAPEMVTDPVTSAELQKVKDNLSALAPTDEEDVTS